MSRQNPDMNRRTAYITRSSVCLPNAPVENHQVEAILGQVGERPSRARRVVQRSNGIRRRYYVIDPLTGSQITPTQASRLPQSRDWPETASPSMTWRAWCAEPPIQIS